MCIRDRLKGVTMTDLLVVGTEERANREEEKVNSQESLETVSYTHLDVYKRQA